MGVDLGGLVGTIGSEAKNIGFLGVGIIAWFGILLIFGAIAGFVTWLYISKKKYKYTIVIFQKIGGQFKPGLRDKACSLKHGKDGTTVFYLRKLKKIIPTPQLQIDNNTYYFFERSDGEWINFLPSDFDEQSKSMGAHFLDKEMRHVRLALEANMKDRFEKKENWLAQNWQMLVGIGFIAMVGVMTFLLFDKWIELAGATNAGVETARQVLEQTNRILSNMDNICSGGSGIIHLE